MKVLLIGTGRWGANHLRVLRSLPIELYVSDLDKARLQTVEKAGVDASHLSTNPRDFFSQVDAAVIVTPAPTHFPLAKELLEAGKDVFVEKPLTLTGKDSRELAAFARRKSRILQVGHILRFDTAAQWLRQAAAEGKFGRITMVRGHFGGFKRPRNDGGVMFADGVHFIDLVSFILGSWPGNVLAIHHDFLGRGMDDVSFVSMEYQTPAGFAWATVENDYFIPGKFRRVVVIGDKMSAICDFNSPQHKIVTWENRHSQDGQDFKAIEGASTPVECQSQEPLDAELRAFIDSVKTRKEPLADGWVGYQTAVVMDGALESVKTGKKVSLRYDCGAD
jgi:predicted dehydrogenase